MVQEYLLFGRIVSDRSQNLLKNIKIDSLKLDFSLIYKQEYTESYLILNKTNNYRNLLVNRTLNKKLNQLTK